MIPAATCFAVVSSTILSKLSADKILKNLSKSVPSPLTSLDTIFPISILANPAIPLLKGKRALPTVFSLSASILISAVPILAIVLINSSKVPPVTLSKTPPPKSIPLNPANP